MPDQFNRDAAGALKRAARALNEAIRLSLPEVGVMRDQFRAFLNDLSTRGGYCLGCLSEMYSASALMVARCLNGIGISSRQATCANCNERRETFRSSISSWLPSPRAQGTPGSQSVRQASSSSSGAVFVARMGMAAGADAWRKNRW
jgi:hypothetical protein